MSSDANSVNPPGCVYLIGAGPGDPDLITIRGRQVLDRCDVVVYDNLVPQELVVCLPAHARIIYAGKKAGDHALPQDEINQLLVTLAREGNAVGRLKGADPLIFGRGGEEARHLKKNGIPFEIIPAVTAAVGAAAYAGIPCTDRERASFVTFATGHKATGKEDSGVPWPQLARCEGGTLVIYMGVGEVGSIVDKLLASGLSGDTAAAIIERGTMPTQRRIICTVELLPATVTKAKVQPPALFVIGDVVGLHRDIEWFGGGPLHGRRVMVLRPADQAGAVYRTLRGLGAEVLPYPTIATREHFDSVAWQPVSRLTGGKLWLVLTSENGVRYFVHQFTETVGDLRRLSPFKIAAIGFGTARALRSFNLKPDFVPETATISALATELVAAHDMDGAEIVRVQGNLSDDTISSTLTAAGATVLPLTVYQTYHPNWPEGFREQLLTRPPDAIMFSSGSTASGLLKLLSAEEITQVASNAVIASIGPSTSKVIQGLGLKVNVEAKTHSLPGLIDALVAHYTDEEKR